MSQAQNSINLLGRKTGGSGVGWVNVLAITLTAIGVLRADWWFTTYVPGNWPSSNWLGIVIVACIGAILWLLAHGVVLIITSRPAADYYFTTRALSAPLGFAASLVGVILGALFVGGMVAALFTLWLPEILRASAMMLPELGLDALAEGIATPQIAILLSTILVVGGFLLVLFSTRSLRVFGGVVFFLLLVWMIILIVLVFTPGPTYVATYERLYSAGIVDQQVNLAVSFGLTPAARPVSPLLLGMVLGLWLFQGGHFAVQGGVEARHSSNGQIIGAVLGFVFVTIMLLVSLLGLERQIPATLLSAHSWLYLRKIAVVEFFLPWSVYYWLVTRPSVVLVGFVVFLWGVSIFGLLLVFLKNFATIIHAWAQDGLVPASWGYIRRGQNAPVVALFVSAALMLVGILLGVGGLSTVLIIYYPYALALSCLAVTLALVFFPFRQREWFLRTPFARWKWGVMSLGFLATAFLGSVVWGAFGLPNYLRLPPQLGLGLIVWLLIGVIWFRICSGFWHSRGVEFSKAFRSLPG